MGETNILRAAHFRSAAAPAAGSLPGAQPKGRAYRLPRQWQDAPKEVGKMPVEANS